MNNLYDHNKYELEYVAGDKMQSEETGITTSVNVQAHAKTFVRYKDQILECELYKAGDEFTLHLLCPKCHHGLKISSKNKQMDWDGKYVSVEPFGCTWEIDTMVAAGVFDYTNLCKWRVGISKGIAKDA